MTAGQVELKEHIEKLFAEFKARYDSERASDLRAFDVFKSGLDEKTKLQALEYERRLVGLNNEADRLQKAQDKTVSADTWNGFQKEFAELKEKVTVEFAAAVGKGQALPYVISIASVLISLAVAAVAFLKLP